MDLCPLPCHQWVQHLSHETFHASFTFCIFYASSIAPHLLGLLFPHIAKRDLCSQCSVTTNCRVHAVCNSCMVKYTWKGMHDGKQEGAELAPPSKFTETLSKGTTGTRACLRHTHNAHL
jgi:hypothetical protein